MTSRARHGAILLAVAAMTGGQPADAQRKIVSGDSYVHGPANAVYPVRVGGFRRSEIYQYDREGKDVSASYSLATPAGRLLITVYIYPAAAAADPTARAGHCEREFGEVNRAISSQHENVAPTERGDAVPMKGVTRNLSHRSVYRFSSPFDDKVQAIRSEAHLYCYVGGRWLVKYRVTAPAAVKTRRPVKTFIRTGPWPGRSST